MIIITNKETNKITEILNELEIIENTWVKSNVGSLIHLDMINVHEVESVPQGAQYYKNNRFYSVDPESKTEVDQEARIKALEDVVLQLLGV